MNMIFHNKRQKLNNQMLILMACVVIPILAFVGYVGIRANHTQLNKLLSEEQANVQSHVYQMDLLLEMLENSLAYLSTEDVRIRDIATADTQDTDFWIDNNAIVQKMKNLTVINPLKFTTFIYYPKQDIFYNYELDHDFSEQIRQMIENQDEDSMPESWDITECNGKYYIYVLMGNQDYFIGAFALVDSFYDGLSLDDEGTFLYTLSDGTILNGKQYESECYLVSASSDNAPFSLVKQLYKEKINQQMTSAVSYVIAAICVVVLLLITYIVFMKIWILNPVNHLKQSMTIIQQGDLNYRIQNVPHMSAEFASVIDEFNFLMDSIEKLKISIYEQKLEQKEVRLEYLNRQIQPHFILNTLNTLYNFTEKDIAVTRKMIKLISEYYRYVVNVDSKYVRLGNELEHLQKYLRLQVMRYPGLFEYYINCPDEYNGALIPPFIIESFVGNIFKHGIMPDEINKIEISTAMENEEWLLIRIEDTGEGFSDDSLDAAREFVEEHKVSEELGVGIRNSIERLQLMYKGNCDIKIFNKDPHGAVVEIRIREQNNEDTGIDS